jgi:hypothetical protein
MTFGLILHEHARMADEWGTQVFNSTLVVNGEGWGGRLLLIS